MSAAGAVGGIGGIGSSGAIAGGDGVIAAVAPIVAPMPTAAPRQPAHRTATSFDPVESVPEAPTANWFAAHRVMATGGERGEGGRVQLADADLSTAGIGLIDRQRPTSSVISQVAAVYESNRLPTPAG